MSLKTTFRKIANITAVVVTLLCVAFIAGIIIYVPIAEKANQRKERLQCYNGMLSRLMDVDSGRGSEFPLWGGTNTSSDMPFTFRGLCRDFNRAALDAGKDTLNTEWVNEHANLQNLHQVSQFLRKFPKLVEMGDPDVVFRTMADFAGGLNQELGLGFSGSSYRVWRDSWDTDESVPDWAKWESFGPTPQRKDLDTLLTNLVVKVCKERLAYLRSCERLHGQEWPQKDQGLLEWMKGACRNLQVFLGGTEAKHWKKLVAKAFPDAPARVQRVPASFY